MDKNKILSEKAKNRDLDFFSLSKAKQKEILSKAARRANKDQLDLIMEYERKLNRVGSGNCK